jgi:putative transcriptional regulator
MTEEELHQNALDDPDNPPRTAEELARMRRIPNPRRLRESLNMTQREFARTFEIGLQTVQDWEDGLHRPDSAAKTYLRLIEHEPEAIIQLLKAAAPEARMTAPEPRQRRVS